MKKLLITMLLSLLPATALADYPKRVLQLLNMIDRSPTAQQLRAAGVDSHGAMLVEIAKDNKLSRYTRSRAASLLGLVKSKRAIQGLSQLADDPKLRDDEVRLTALLSLCQVSKPAAVQRLMPMLQAQDPQHRAIAIKQLAALGELTPLSARLQIEQKPWVRALIQRKLSRR